MVVPVRLCGRRRLGWSLPDLCRNYFFCRCSSRFLGVRMFLSGNRNCMSFVRLRLERLIRFGLGGESDQGVLSSRSDGGAR